MSVAEYWEEIREIRCRYKNYIHDDEPKETIRAAMDSLRKFLNVIDEIEFDESFGDFDDNELCETLDYHYGKIDTIINRKLKITRKHRLSK